MNQAYVKRAIQYLASVCDYAVTDDGHGFNGRDAEIGHSLAEQSRTRDLTPRQLEIAVKMCRLYQGQLRRAGIDWEKALTEEPVIKPVATVEKPKIQFNGRITLQNEKLAVTFPYDPANVAKIKGVPGRAWDPNNRHWTVPIEQLQTVQNTFPGFELDSRTQAEIDRKDAATSAAKQARDAEVKRLLESLGDLSAPLPNRQTLYAHQQKAVRQMLAQGRLILADDMGLGKTKTALVAAKAYQKVFGCTIFVVCPASLRENWLREAVQVEVEIETWSWAKLPVPPDEKQFVLICDEAHYAQSLKSKRTKDMLALADKARAVFLVTGTPIKNGRPVNLFPLLLASQHELSSDKREYERRYCAARATRWTRWDTTGAAHLDELHKKTQNVILRRMKKDCLDLPEKTRVLRRAELSAEAENVYHAVFEALRQQYKERLAAGEIQTGGDALVMLNHLRHAGSISKIECAVSIAQEVLEQNQQAVLFTEFQETARGIADALQPYGVEVLTGDTPACERQGMVDRFQAGQSRVFVGTIKAGGLGITLTSAQTVVLVDRPWTPGDAIQAEDRLHRIGQQNAVLVVWLQTNGVDEKIDAILLRKYERIELVLQGKRKTMSFKGMESPEEIAQALLDDLYA